MQLVCTRCGGQIGEIVTEVSCLSCRSSWELVNGLPCFLKERVYWGEVPQSRMQEINRRSKENGWRLALEELLKSENPSIYNYVISPHRAKFKYILQGLEDAAILDIGSGWGSIAIDLSRECKEVTAIENVIERATFTKVRAEQDNIRNLDIIICDLKELPLQEEYYDFIIINGVLEYVGLYDRNRDPREQQVDALRLLRRFLKPSGSLYIGIENRFGESAWRGAPDHSGLAYTSLMPRKLAEIYCNYMKKCGYGTDTFLGGYRTYTYSWRGYRKVLQEAGFRSIQFFEVYPAYEAPCIIIPLSERRQRAFVSEYVLRSRSLTGFVRAWFMRCIRAINLQALLPDHFGIVASLKGPEDGQ